MSSSPCPFLPYGRQSITEADIAAVESVLRSPFLTQGPVVPSFEQAIAEKVNATYGVAVNSATSALHIACLALGLGPGDRLWTSPITFVASANCGLYCGATVDFVDIDVDTGLMSMESLAAKLKNAERTGTLPKVVIPVHLAGTSCDMVQISKFAEQYGFSVIEDASHAIGGQYIGSPVGNCRFSSITVFSFHPVKIITSGEGGIATTNDYALAQCMLDLRSHGIIKDQSRFERSPVGSWSYEQQKLGFNYRLTDLQAALGLSQLNRLDDIVIERNSLRQIYLERLSPLPLNLLNIPNNTRSALHLAVILLDKCDSTYHREVFEQLRSLGIGVQLHYSPVHLNPYYQRLGFSEDDFPYAEEYSRRAISLPLFPGLDRSDMDRVVFALTDILAK